MNVKKLAVGTALLMFVPMAAGCQSSDQSPGADQKVSGSMHHYESVQDLGKSSDAVVMGKIQSVEKTTDNGGDSAAPALPVWLAEFRVARSNPALPKTITVVLPDFDKEVDDDFPRVEQGKPYVIFVRASQPNDHPGIARDGLLYIPRGGAQGIFEVSGGSARSLFPGGIAKTQGTRPVTDADFGVDQLMATATK